MRAFAIFWMLWATAWSVYVVWGAVDGFISPWVSGSCLAVYVFCFLYWLRELLERKTRGRWRL